MSRTGEERGNLNLSVFVWCMTLLIQYFPQSAWAGDPHGMTHLAASPPSYCVSSSTNCERMWLTFKSFASSSTGLTMSLLDGIPRVVTACVL
jgi:hypothetical protein